MADPNTLHQALLRPAVLHILRAAGFQSSKPSVVDTLTDLCSRHLLLLAERTARSTYDRTDEWCSPFATTELVEVTGEDADAVLHDHVSRSHPQADIPAQAQQPDMPHISGRFSGEPQSEVRLQPTAATPTVTDVLAAFVSTSVFNSTLTASEEAWREALRRPLSSYSEEASRMKECQRRDAEDTKDVTEFIDWCTGHAAAEIRRVAGTEVKFIEAMGLPSVMAFATNTNADLAGADAPTQMPAPGGETNMEKIRPDDYVTQMKKKYSRTGDGARYAGTVLGVRHAGEGGDDRGLVRIEGGPESVQEWSRKRRMVAGGDKGHSVDAT